MHPDILKTRIEALQREYEAGAQQLRALDQRKEELQRTMLRISGAIQVLEELLREAPTTDPQSPPDEAAS